MKLPWGSSDPFPARVRIVFIDDPHEDLGGTAPQKQILRYLAEDRVRVLRQFGHAPDGAVVPEHVAALIYHSGCRAQFVEMESGEPWHP